MSALDKIDGAIPNLKWYASDLVKILKYRRLNTF